MLITNCIPWNRLIACHTNTLRIIYFSLLHPSYSFLSSSQLHFRHFHFISFYFSQFCFLFSFLLCHFSYTNLCALSRTLPLFLYIIFLTSKLFNFEEENSASGCFVFTSSCRIISFAFKFQKLLPSHTDTRRYWFLYWFSLLNRLLRKLTQMFGKMQCMGSEIVDIPATDPAFCANAFAQFHLLSSLPFLSLAIAFLRV